MGEDEFIRQSVINDGTSSTVKDKYLKTLTDNASWDPWLKGAGVGVGVVNMAMNMGMYGTNKRNAQAQTNLYNTQVAEINQKMKQKQDSINAISRGMA
jgi:hypothetical protein